MLASRKALLSNLNYVHLQHVSLGVHLSMLPEVTDAPPNQDTGLKDGCHHNWKETMIDPNSNDPSIPCQCCDQHSEKEVSLQYSSLEDLDTIICDDCLSPDDLPLSPLSLSSPSTDSSSSSDFTLDDSPASMYYKEYSHDGIDTPDQQPDIIPLDSATEGPFSPIDPAQSNPSDNNNLEITNNNLQEEETPFIDWESDSMLDSNSNTLIEKSGSSSMNSNTITEPEVQATQTGQVVENICADHWSGEEDLLPGLPSLENTSNSTPKKTITSFHELALKRRKSGAQPTSEPKRDRSDWLIVFSPDTEQPPLNELTASAFHHSVLEPQTNSLPAGKEVTTFRELRYRNAQNKQSSQQVKVIEDRQSMEATSEPLCTGEVLGPSWEPPCTGKVLLPKWEAQCIGEALLPTWEPEEPQKQIPPQRELADVTMKGHDIQRKESSGSMSAACRSGPQTLELHMHPGSDHVLSGWTDTLMTVRKKGILHKGNTDKGDWMRGMADGGDRRGLEAARTLANVILKVPNLQTLHPFSPMSPHSSGLDYPRPSGPAALPSYPSFSPRQSPVGASSPPHRTLLPMLDTPDIAVLLSPMFPRKRTFFRVTRGYEDGCKTLTDPRDTVADCELLMADEAEDYEQRQKKSLLVAVGSSVEKIISHFNTSRNQVQKAQLGDSRLSPVLGYLVLNHLCPSLYSLLANGLKPYQKDVIVGRRRLSPWSLVEASMKFHGLENMQLLFSKVNRLTQLRDSQRKFNAFIFGLLNMKQLDVWVLHLHQIYNQLSIFYLPSGFLPLAATLQPELRDELLLSLQPLSALTFHTDLLFEHHHLSLQDLPTPQRVHSPAHVAEHWVVPSLQTILDLGGWITHNLTWNTENKAQSPIKGKSMDSPGDKCFRDGSQPDLQTSPGDMSDHSVHVSSETTESMAACDTKTSSDQIPSREVTSTWWNHLSQASRIYIPTSKESVTFSTLKKLTSWGSTDRELSQKASASKATDCPQQRLRDTITNTGAAQNTAYENEQPPVDTEEDNPGVDNAALSSAASDGTSYGPGVDNAALSSAASDGTSYGDGPEQIETPITKAQPPNNHEKATWLGQLFGAGSTHGPEMEARNSKSRRPSSWLPPNVSVWNLIRKQETAMRPEILEHKEVESRQRQQIRPQRSLRAICDHSASGEAQLSFKKGDVLQLLGTVDEDWIQCRRGNDAGLVPVGYTSLIL